MLRMLLTFAVALGIAYFIGWHFDLLPWTQGEPEPVGTGALEPGAASHIDESLDHPATRSRMPCRPAAAGVVERFAIDGWHLAAIDKELVPSMRDGQLLFLGKEVPQAVVDKLSPAQKARLYQCRYYDGDATRKLY